MAKLSKRVREARETAMNDLYRQWARNRWPGRTPEVPDWNDVETAFRAGFYLAITETADGVKGLDRG